jgi:hypothetical protein
VEVGVALARVMKAGTTEMVLVMVALKEVEVEVALALALAEVLSFITEQSQQWNGHLMKMGKCCWKSQQ